MKKIIALAALAFGLITVTSAQVGLTPLQLTINGNEYTLPAASYDTVIKSTTYFWVAPLNSTNAQSPSGHSQYLSYSVAIDSVGGTPNATVTPYMSNDGHHWVVNGSAIVFNSAKNYWHTSSTVPGVSDSVVTVSVNPWPAKYFGLKIVVNSNTQRAIYHIWAKSLNVY